jgi:hypothetical protein
VIELRGSAHDCFRAARPLAEWLQTAIILLSICTGLMAEGGHILAAIADLQEQATEAHPPNCWS